MAEPQAQTPRERYRAQVKAEIKQYAWEQIATAGTSALSLNAIAKRMGMSGPALYRYFAGRDELITELVREAYRSLADTLRTAAGEAGAAGVSGASEATGAAASGVPGEPEAIAPPPERYATSAATEAAAPPESGAVVALAHALRGWALDDPHRYFLVYGTPIPGYHAPDDITAIAAEVMSVLLDACVAVPDGDPAAPFAAHLADHRQWAHGHPAPPVALHRALTVWTRLHGVLSLELAGHFAGMGFDSGQLFDAELQALSAP
ncbi:helix-turn-helix transcriptional regulator [Streptomyces sp. SID10853]|uniref:WHG domain-containing protein n=1 Tax=Streptomyces sp. SID10853 TaxID=2706028 RepID=UPI0013BF8307|nr:helix-turn-helix transcriptional regulator [Streptomyces sp. SID10853]